MGGYSGIRAVTAVGFAQRMRGLIGHGADWLACDEALCFPCCRSVHTFFMRACIDVAFIDARGYVLRSIECLAPGRIVSCRGACAVFERFSEGGFDERLARQRPPWPQEGDVLSLTFAGSQHLCKK